MITAPRDYFYRGVMFAASLSFFAPVAVVFSAENGDADIAVITCPPEIQGLRLNYTTKYTPPKGWGHADAYSFKSKGGVLNNLTLQLNGHQINARNLICRYGAVSGDRQIHLASTKRTIPRGASCTLEAEYSFRCTGMVE